MSEKVVLKYFVCLVLCAVVAIIYTATRRTGTKNIMRDACVVMGYICGGMFGIGVIVYLLCLLK